MLALARLAWGFATSKLGLSVIAVAAALIALGLHLAGDAAVKRQRDQARAEAKTWRTAAVDWKAASGRYEKALGRSEGLRAAEYSDARTAAGDAASACAVRLTEARRSAAAIASLLEKPVATDPATHCPARRVYGADELRHALESPR